MNLLFKNGTVISENFHRVSKDILVSDGIIQKIETSITEFPKDTLIILLNGKLIFDGFADSHMHLDKALINEAVCNQSGTLTEAIRIMGNYKKQMNHQDVKERAERLLQMAYKNGTRYIRTHVDIDHIIGLKSLHALLELKRQWKNKIQIQIVAFPQEGILQNNNDLEILEQALKEGADLIGGIPATEPNSMLHIQKIFELAKKYQVGIDMHIDETDDSDSLTIQELCACTCFYEYQGSVTAGHLCSLAANDPLTVDSILDSMGRAKIQVISLPSTNLYLQGRHDLLNIRRGIAPIRRIHEEGILTAIASDNIRDPFNPFGNANLLEEALITAHGCHMGGFQDLEILFDMITTHPRKIMRIPSQILEGAPAAFLILNEASGAEAIISQSEIYGYFNENRSFIMNSPICHS